MNEGFELREFLKKGFLGAVGQKPDYKIRLGAGEWFKLGILLEEDLAEINSALESHDTPTAE
jgi:hypothetical protein